MIVNLLVTGIAFAFVGLSCLLDPVAALTHTMGIHFEGVSGLSQIRASNGGATAAMGAFMIVSAMIPALRLPACWLVVVVLGGLEAGRVHSYFVDGAPASWVWISIGLEWLGLLQGLYWLRKAIELDRELRS